MCPHKLKCGQISNISVKFAFYMQILLQVQVGHVDF